MTINYIDNGSPYNGYIKMPFSELTTNQFMDVGVIKIGLLNNQEALYNHSFQTRLNVMYRNPVVFTNPTNISASSNTWQRVGEFQFPLTMTKFGVCGLYGECLMYTGKAGETATVALTFATPGVTPPLPDRSPTANYFSTAFYDTPTWVTASVGSGSVLFPVPEIASAYFKNSPTRTDGTTFSIDQSREVMVNCGVWTSVPSGSTSCGFQGLILREMPFVIP